MKRSFLAAFAGVVMLAQSCSSHVEDAGTTAAPLAGQCGSATATVTFGSGGATGTNPLLGLTRIFIPNEVTFASGDYFFPVIATEGHVDGTLNFDGGVSCYYSAPLPSSQVGQGIEPAPPLQFTSCSNGLTAGSVIVTSSATLEGSYTPSDENATFHASALLAVDMDDGKPCTKDYCVGSQIHNDALPPGTVVSDGDPCNGTETCDGAGNVVPGTALASPIVQGCNTLTCDPSHGGYYVSSSTCTSPAGVTQYANNGTLPSDIGAGMQFLVPPGKTVDSTRIAVVRGRVIKRDDGLPLQNVSVSVVGHPEFGTVVTRATGEYDIAVNGGGDVTLQ